MVFNFGRSMDLVMARQLTPAPLFSLITAVAFVWPLAGEHEELRTVHELEGAMEDGVRYPTEHPSDYPVVWETLRAMLNLRSVMIDALTVRPPMQAVLSQRELVEKWLRPMDDLMIHSALTLKEATIWIPESIFGTIEEVVEHDTPPGYGLFCTVECHGSVVGYWVGSREDIGKIIGPSIFDHK